MWNLRIALKNNNKNPVSEKQKVGRRGERARGRWGKGRETGREQAVKSHHFKPPPPALF